MSRPQAPPAATRKQRCPARILYYFHLMNDNTLALTTLRDLVAADILCRGHLAAPFIKSQQEKKARKVRYGKCFFGRLMIAAKGKSPVRASRISFRADEQA
jgi:hypothetical protein